MSCSKTPDAARVAEAAAIAHAIDQLRQAPNSAKRPHLSALAKQPCTAPPICELKKLCHRAYAEHISALDEIAKATDELDRVAAAELDRRLESARSRLVAAEQAAQRCVTQQAALRDEFGLNQ